MAQGVVRARGVSHWFASGSRVLDDVDLAVAPGEVVLLSGRNGAGKTTLLRILTGVLRARTGTVERTGRLGYLPQRGDEPPPRVVVRDWLSALHGMRGARGQSDGPSLCAALGVPAVDLRLDRTSRGTVAKIMLAAALADGPDVVVLDEPLASLDAAGRSAAAGLVQDTAHRGAAVLVSEHGHGDLLGATRAVQLAGGRLEELSVDAQLTWRLVVSGPGGVRHLLAAAADRDRLLHEALHAGEQVLRVEPA